MEARIITDRQQWDEFVAASKCCNITQSFEWGELAPHLGAEAMYAGVVDEQGNLCAAMLVLISTAPVLHRTYFYAPRGPVIDDPDSPAMTVLLNFVKAEAHKRGAFMLKVEPSVADGDERWLSALQKRGFRTTPYASHIRGEGQADVDSFYRIYRTTSERDQFFIHNKAHYEDVMRLYSEGDRAALFLAEYEGEAIAGIIVLRFGRWSWYMYGASS